MDPTDRSGLDPICFGEVTTSTAGIDTVVPLIVHKTNAPETSRFLVLRDETFLLRQKETLTRRPECQKKTEKEAVSTMA